MAHPSVHALPWIVNAVILSAVVIVGIGFDWLWNLYFGRDLSIGITSAMIFNALWTGWIFSGRREARDEKRRMDEAAEG